MCSIGRGDREATNHASLQARHFVAKRAQSRAKKHVLFEAIAATLRADHLALKRSQIEFGRPVQEDIDAFVGDCGRVCIDDCLERFESWTT
jgi:surfactin synthase thioesterase subunit